MKPAVHMSISNLSTACSGIEAASAASGVKPTNVPAPSLGVTQENSVRHLHDRAQVSLESSGEHVRELVAHSTDLQAQQRYAANAFKLYRKTRPAPAPESVKRAKGLATEGIHPVLAASVPSTSFGACLRVSSTHPPSHACSNISAVVR